MTVLGAPDSSCVAMMQKEMGMDEDSIRDCIAKIQEWLLKQPHLPPQASDERRLRRLLTCHKFSVERCKKTLDAYYSLRTSMPEFFRNRDPLSKKLQQAMDVVGIMPLPKCTPEGRRVSVLRILIPDASLTDGYEVAKFSMMCTDIRTFEDTSVGDIFVIDLNGISVGHLPIVNAVLLKKLEMLYRLAFATRVSAFYYLNAPKFVDMLVNILKSSFVPKLASRVRIHTREDGFDELHKSVPPSILPAEYGGSAGKFNDMYDDWKKKIYEYRDWFLKEESVGVREDRRPSSNNMAKDYDIYGTQGTFRQLSID